MTTKPEGPTSIILTGYERLNPFNRSSWCDIAPVHPTDTSQARFDVQSELSSSSGFASVQTWGELVRLSLSAHRRTMFYPCSCHPFGCVALEHLRHRWRRHRWFHNYMLSPILPRCDHPVAHNSCSFASPCQVAPGSGSDVPDPSITLIPTTG